MHNFKVLKNNGQYRVCDHQFKLVFIGVIVVRECVLGDIPFRKYRFAGFADVVTGQFEHGLLVDVIGVVEEVVFRQVLGKGRRVVFKLKDLSQQLLSCTLWDDYCLQFVKFLDDYEGSYPTSINNFFKASKLIINQPVMEIQEFNERLAELGIEARSGFKSHGEGSTQLLGSIQLSSKESFFGKAEAKTIVEINAISEEIVCVTVGTITRIVLDNHSWCYTACIQCHKKSDAEMAPFTCACGKYNKEVVLRYRLEVMINQGNESTKFLLWDRECSELIGQSADAVNKLKIEKDGDVDLNASPQALDKLLGHELAFKIKVQPKFRNSAVLKCSADSSFINVVMDILADAETSSKMDILVSDSNHFAQHESQSLSVTADHDPLLGLPLTPTKRQTFQDFLVVGGDFGVRLWFPVRDFRSSVVEELASLCNFMARIPDKIRSIDGSKEMLKLAVRITDLWFVGAPNKFEQAEMVFVDSEGDQIHAICKSDHLKSWKVDLKENCTYVMHNFKVVKNDGQFRVCEHEYKLFFIGVTVVKEVDLHELPFKEFRFVEFANVVAGNFVSGLLVDIIGVVDQVVFRHVSSKNTRVVFRMKDLSGEILSCTLWENYCTQFLSYLNERGDDGPMVIILTHARIKDAQGSYPASVSNSFKASKLLINDPILEIQEFKERLLDLGVEVSRVLLPGDQASSQVSGGSQLSSKDSFLSKAEAKTILEINAISEVDLYRVEVMVTQNNENSKFLLWDRECAELIGETVDDVNRVKIEDGDLDLNASPQALDKLLGHVLAFKVRIQSKFKNAVVLRYSKDLDLINVVLKMLPYSETCSKIDPSNVDCNDATQVERQSLSVTADHDPVAGLPLTPKKRMSYDEADDELGSSQISSAQLSIASFLILNMTLKTIDFFGFMQQSLSVTADHDPVAGLPLTPKKRMSYDEADDELGSSQISSAQLSSNKLTRHSHKS
ncbi:Replication protein A DNA-binding subunit C [Glycine max]|nr:Replication protein A DNA-binding subunit C [Glycine max]